jgi:uncharacterized protein YukE
MATLHMEVEAVQGTQQKMVTEKDAMLNELATLTSQIYQTVGSTWVGNSANEFQQQYDVLRDQISKQLEALGQLAQAMQTEIAQWQEMSARMG